MVSSINLPTHWYSDHLRVKDFVINCIFKLVMLAIIRVDSQTKRSCYYVKRAAVAVLITVGVTVKVDLSCSKTIKDGNLFEHDSEYAIVISITHKIFLQSNSTKIRKKRHELPLINKIFMSRTNVKSQHISCLKR